MINRKSSIILVLLLLSGSVAFAQKTDKALIKKQLEKTTYEMGSDADAIVLSEKCTVRILESGTGYRESYKVYRMIKVFHTSGNEEGSINEQFRDKNNKTNTADSIRGTVYNLVGGKVAETPFTKKQAEISTIDKFNSAVDFTWKGMKDGCIVEYQFVINGPVSNLMPEWEFRAKLPKLESEYEVDAPAGFKFNDISPVPVSFREYDAQDSAIRTAAAWKTTEKKGARMVVRWHKRNMPALKREPFYGTIDNAREQFSLQIDGYNVGEQEGYWNMLNDYFWQNEHFGAQIAKSAKAIKQLTDSVVGKANAPLEKAQRIFGYVQTAYDCNNNAGAMLRRDLEDIIKNRSASEVEMNMLLVAMLRAAQIKASALVLSRLGTPKPSPVYPLVSAFNYMVARAELEGKIYNLDASNKFNVFGMLPIYCYNGYARVVDEKGSGLYFSSKDCADHNSQELYITNVHDTEMDMQLVEQKGIIESVYMRNTMSVDTGALAAYVSKRIAPFGSATVVKYSGVDNLDKTDKMLQIRASFKAKTTQRKNDIVIKTDYLKLFSTMPFNAGPRTLPVEFPSAFTYTYKLSVAIPEGYVCDSLPVARNGNMPSGALQYTHSISADKQAKTIQVATVLSINDPNIPLKDYDQLRVFFEGMLKELSATIVFKKGQ